MNQPPSAAPPADPPMRRSATSVRSTAWRLPGSSWFAAPPPAPLTEHNHPLARRNYRVATSAIEAFIDLVEHCVQVLIPGALIYARPRMGKTHAIDYVALHLAKHRPDILVLRIEGEPLFRDRGIPRRCAMSHCIRPQACCAGSACSTSASSLKARLRSKKC